MTYSPLDQIFVIAKQWLLDLLGRYLPSWASQVAVPLASIFLNIAGILAVYYTIFALISLFERKILGRIQNRYGPNRVGPWGLFQPVADGIKLIIKEDIVPRNADQVIHFLAPLVMVQPAFYGLCVIPVGRNMTPFSIDGGILFFFALGSAAELAVFMAGWASNNKYSMLGAMRAIAQMVSYELPLILAALPVVMIAGSLRPDEIVDAQGGYHFGTIPNWFCFTPWGFAAFILFFIAAMVESNRSPFDLPEGESELVAGHMTEYSGFKYATFFVAEYLGLFAILGLCVTLFLGGWHAPTAWLQFIPSYCWYFGKLLMLIFVCIWVRGTVPRFRFDQVMTFSWKFMIPMALVCLLSTAVWHYAGRGLLGWACALGMIIGAYLGLTYALDARQRMASRVYRYAE
jgi:NADH-quinone oxidoreductase subunit H